ncbi:MAG: IclR family transcriptional regulator [Tannerellaceae bacterium]
MKQNKDIKIMPKAAKKEELEDQESKYTVPMLTKGMEILEFVSEFPGGVTIQEMHEKTKLSKTTVFRIANSFLEMGYLYKDEETKRFALTQRIFKLGLSSLGGSNLVERSLRPMQKLRDRIKEAVMLGALVNDKVVLLEQVLGSHNFTFILKPGAAFCLHASAPGKVLLAFCDETQREEILNGMTFEVFNKRTIASADAMRKELEKVRKLGYGVDLEEELAGVNCVAAPVFNQFGQVIASIWTSGPSGRLTKQEFPQIAQAIMDTAKDISASLGYIE